jgi:hypothetical protein
LTFEEDYEVIGSSGVGQVFDIALISKDAKPLLIDLDFSGSPLSMVSVISFFAKKLDVRDSASGFVLVVNNVDAAAVELSRLYGLRVCQYNGSRVIPLEGREESLLAT